MIKKHKIFIKREPLDYVCHIPLLSTVSVGQNIDKMIAEAIKRIEEDESDNRNPSRSLKKHIKYLSIFTFSLLILLFMGSILFRQFIDYRILRFEGQVRKAFNASEKRKKKRVDSFKTKLEQVKPYCVEIKSLLE